MGTEGADPPLGTGIISYSPALASRPSAVSPQLQLSGWSWQRNPWKFFSCCVCRVQIWQLGWKLNQIWPLLIYSSLEKRFSLKNQPRVLERARITWRMISGTRSHLSQNTAEHAGDVLLWVVTLHQLSAPPGEASAPRDGRPGPQLTCWERCVGC